MSINVKKYTKDQMAKMVEDAQAEVQELKRVNATMTEQIDQMNGEAINKANEIANLKADLDSAKNTAQNLNDQGQQYWRAWQASKREVADLKNKLTDTEVALGRANACIATMKVERDQQTKDLFQWRSSAQALHDDLLDARDRANYAEAHPWRNLWAWVKRKLGGKGNEHVS
nr:MAG TPA: hypothetical protein [Caudoviricetes sp.]